MKTALRLVLLVMVCPFVANPRTPSLLEIPQVAVAPAPWRCALTNVNDGFNAFETLTGSLVDFAGEIGLIQAAFIITTATARSVNCAFIRFDFES